MHFRAATISRLLGKKVELMKTFFSHDLHDLGLADHGADGIAVGHGLAEGGQVRRDAVALLGAAQGRAEARADLVEDQHGPVLSARARTPSR